MHAENYRTPHAPDGESGKRRIERKQDQHPRLAVLSGSGNLDSGIPMFDQDESKGAKPLIYTSENGNENLSENFQEKAEVVTLGVGPVDLSFVLRDLFDRGAKVVLAEGGPSLNHQLVEAQLVDELCLTISPLLVAVSYTHLTLPTICSV